MKHSKKIEIMARTICQLRGLNPDQSYPGMCGDPAWQFYQKEAEAFVVIVNRLQKK